jgi:hypothetical protein
MNGIRQSAWRGEGREKKLLLLSWGQKYCSFYRITEKLPKIVEFTITDWGGGGSNYPIKTSDKETPKQGTENPKIMTVLQQKPYTHR